MVEILHQELYLLYTEDQNDRRPNYLPDTPNRDRQRQERVKMLICQNQVQAPEDFFHAAVIFLHSIVLEDTWQAYQLALQACALDYRPARRLAAMAYDRWLIKQDRPQKYGTQYLLDGYSWKLCELDPRTTDDERIAWDVPPLEQILNQEGRNA